MGVVNRFLSYKEFGLLFYDFGRVVKSKEYNALAYQMWKSIQKDLSSMPSDTEIEIVYDSYAKSISIYTAKMCHRVEVGNQSFGDYLFDQLGFIDPYYCDYYDYDKRKLELQGTASMNYPLPKYEIKTDIAASESAVNNIKEDNKMKFNFDFGPVDSNIRMSPFGMAIKNAEGTYVSYNATDKQIVDVDVFNFSGSNFMFKMPVALNDVKPGDIVVHQRKPMFVTNIDGNILGVIDIYSGEAKGVVPTTNMFGFNFVTKVVSFLDIGTPTQDNPFGNMWPLFMLGDGKNMDNKQMLMFMFMMSQNKNAPATMFQNPMFMLALMQDGDMKDMMPLVMAMTMTQNAQPHVCQCGGNCGNHQE